MPHSIRNGIAAVLVAMAAATTPLDAQSPSPSPAVSPSPATAPTLAPKSSTHRVIVSCLVAPFYSWPDRTVVPSGTSYPAARLGDAFDVTGTGTLTNDGMNLTETTIDVVKPFGSGKHYWISTACIN